LSHILYLQILLQVLFQNCLLLFQLKELLKSLYKNHGDYDKLTNKIVAKACCYCLKNRYSIYCSDDFYLYPYSVIKVKDEDVVEVNLEKIKNNGDKTIFEIVYN